MWNSVKLWALDSFCSLQVWFQCQLEFTSTTFIFTDICNYKGFILIINHLIWAFLLHIMFVLDCLCNSEHRLHF